MLSSRMDLRSKFFGVALAAVLVSAVAVPVSSSTDARATDSRTVSISDFDPVVAFPQAFTVTLNNFSVAKTFQVSMTASSGTLSLATETGLTESPPVKMTDAAEIRFTGGLTAIQNALTNMTFEGSVAGEVTLDVNVTEIPEVTSNPARDWETTSLYFNSDNGRYYEYVKSTTDISWTDARARAGERSILGADGYLATLTSEAENNFVATSIQADSVWIGASDRVDIVNAAVTGANYANQAAVEGKWHWVTGPEDERVQITTNNTVEQVGGCARDGKFYVVPAVEGQFNSWACGEPNNYEDGVPGEHFAVTNWRNTTGAWNDLPDSSDDASAFLVEYSVVQSPESGQTSATRSVSAMPAATITSVVAGNAQATTSWTAPSAGTVEGYTVTATPGGQSCTATSTQDFCTVVGLTNGTDYVFEVETSFDGTDQTSVATSDSVTPVDSAPGLTGPDTRQAAVDSPATIGSFTISDPFTCGWGEMTATMTASAGTVSAEGSGSAVVTGSGTATMTVRGTQADVQATISQATFQSDSAGDVTVTTDVVPSVDFTAPDGKRYHLNRDTGHYYRVLTNPDFLTEEEAISRPPAADQQAKAAAAARNLSFCGFRGYLVAVDDEDEQSFIETSGAFDAIDPRRSLYSSGRLVGSEWRWEPGNGAPANQYPKNFYDQGAVKGRAPWHTNQPDNSGVTHAFWYTSNRYGWDDIGENSNPGGPGPENYGALVEFGATTSFSTPSVTTAITVTNDPTQLGLSVAPVLGLSGSVMTVQPVVEIRNAAGIRLDSATNQVTVSIASGTGGQLGGTLTVTAVDGVATFSGLTFQGTVGQQYVLRFQSTGLTDVDTAALTIVAPAADDTNPPSDNTSNGTNNGTGNGTGNGTVTNPGAGTNGQGDNRAPTNGNGATNQATTPAPTNNTPTQALPPGRTPTPGSPPPPLAGPLPGVNGNGGQAPQAPTALIGGRPAEVNTSVVGGNQVNLQTGGASFGLAIGQGQGSVAAQGGNTELAVESGASTRLSGSGLFPGSTVQIFMPLGSNGSREIAQFPVDPSGAFDGDAVFTTRPTDPPLPIGRHVLQIASLNEAGERVIVEMAINIAQPAPAPEILRTNGEIPGLTPGQSLATRAGEQIDVVLTVDPTNSITTVDGDGWTFSIDVSGNGNNVEQTPDGGALISVVRGGEASISGNGFMPQSRADIFLFSDPTLLGSVDIDENGEFNGTVIVDGRVVPVGDHTLQIQGVGVDGFVLAANLGVVVTDGDLEATTTTTGDAAAGVLWWVVGLIALLVVAVVVWWVIRRRASEAY